MRWITDAEPVAQRLPLLTQGQTIDFLDFQLRWHVILFGQENYVVAAFL